MSPCVPVPTMQRARVQAAPLSARLVALSAVVGPLSGFPCWVQVAAVGGADDGAERSVGDAVGVRNAGDAAERVAGPARLRYPSRAAVGRLEHDRGDADDRTGRVAGAGRAGDRVERGSRAARLRTPGGTAVAGADDRPGCADREAGRGRGARDAVECVRAGARPAVPRRAVRRVAHRGGTGGTAPTAAQVVVEAQLTPLRFCVVPLVCGSQVWPPFVVFRIVPALPAAKQVPWSGRRCRSSAASCRRRPAASSLRRRWSSGA